MRDKRLAPSGLWCIETLAVMTLVGSTLLAGCAALPGPQPPWSAPRLSPSRASASATPTLLVFPTPTQDGTVIDLRPVVSTPVSVSMKTVCSQAREYLVAAGDTIERVAQRFEVPTGQLAAVNRVDPVGPLSEGSRLVIPCAPSVASAPTLAVIAEATPNSSAIVPQTIGFSALGLPLEVYRLGNGSARIVFVGGIHGGYEWNTVLLAYSVLDYLTANPASIPPNTTVEIVPAANPDGVVEVVGHPGRFSVAEVAADTRPGRFNGNGVDLNRNWDCHWAPVGLWGKTEVSGGAAPHSEPETQVLSAFLRDPPVQAVIFWHSAVPGVFAGGCEESFAPSTALAQVYAAASGYPYESAFTSYIVTGDSVDWLAAQGVPAIEVELRTHDELDWEQNIAGVLAVMADYSAGER